MECVFALQRDGGIFWVLSTEGAWKPVQSGGAFDWFLQDGAFLGGVWFMQVERDGFFRRLHY